MDILRYSDRNTYQDQQGVKTAADLRVSVEDLAYSMRQDLFQQQQQTTHELHQASHHSDSVPHNQNSNALLPSQQDTSSSRSDSSLSGCSSVSLSAHINGRSPSEQAHQMQSYQISSALNGHQNGHPGMMNYSPVQHASPVQHTSPVHQPTIQNHHAIEQVTFTKSAKSFYQELYGQTDNNNSVVATQTGQRSVYDSPQDDDNLESPRMLPKPPMEPRRSKTRSSLRRAAKALLNRSRQNLSESDTKPRKPEKPSPPADVKLKRSGSIRDKLKENRNKMAEVLRKPAFMRRSSQGNEITTDPRSFEHNSRRQYGSTGNLNPNMDDVDDTAPVYNHHPTPGQALPPHHTTDPLSPTQRYNSLDNVRPNFPSNDDLRHLSSHQRPRLSHSSTSDLDSSQNSGSESRGYGGIPRGSSPGYQLRRHSSGPVYNMMSPRDMVDNVKRGYHTADSDTDSSVSRHDGYWPQTSNRHDARRPLPSTRDTLRMLQKKREGAHPGQQRAMGKMQSGPLRADHNIQTVRKEESSPMEIGKDPWLEQGARPKRTQSTESLETEEVRHEVLPDSVIRVDSDQVNDRQSRTSNHVDNRSSRDSSIGRSRQRAPSPCRSVHFEEDSNSSPQHYRTSNNKAPSRSALRTPVDYKNRSGNVSDASPYDSEYSTTSEVVDTQYQYRDNSLEQNRNNSGYVNPVADIGLEHGNHAYYGHNGSVMGDSIDSGSPSSQRSGHHGYQQGIPNGSNFHPASRGQTPVGSQSPNHTNQYGNTLDVPGRSRPNSRGSHRNDPSNRKRASSQPPLSKHNKSSTMRPAGSRESIASSGSNPCIVSDHDDSIMQIGTEINDRRGQPYMSDLEKYSDISSSQLSIASRTSISDKVQNMGRATKKKFHSMRRALSLDRMDKAGSSHVDAPNKLKKSPSLRSLTSILGKKKNKKDDSDAEYPSQLDKKHRSASVIGLYNRPQRSSFDTDVTTPSHGRKVGKLISSDPNGTQVIELVKPPAGPFGFYIARGTYDFGSGIFVTRLGDGHPAKILVGLLGVGDEILEINGENVRSKPIDDVYDIMMDNNTLVLKIMPLMTRNKTK
ncbi:uncharacterized protein [Amphiura filiformis]|uniref:uncharacterized protein n=1 Tax=Amphiura filiformis TaxID=82378 RepID=UPI003B21917D